MPKRLRPNSHFVVLESKHSLTPRPATHSISTTSSAGVALFKAGRFHGDAVTVVVSSARSLAESLDEQGIYCDGSGASIHYDD